MRCGRGIMKLMRGFVFFLMVAAALSACKSVADPSAVSSNAKRYQFKGKVVAVDRTAKTATIDHDAVENYMPAMTMTFPVHADWVWDDLVPGSEVRAELVVDNTSKEGYWLENIGIVAAPIPGQTVATNDNFA